MINLAFWTIYFFAKPGNYFLYLSMANAVVRALKVKKVKTLSN